MEENSIKKCKCCGRVIPNPAKSTIYCPRCRPKSTVKDVAKNVGLGVVGTALAVGLAVVGEKAVEHAPDIIDTIRKIK